MEVKKKDESDEDPLKNSKAKSQKSKLKGFFTFYF
jgi:hypothetical protein